MVKITEFVENCEKDICFKHQVSFICNGFNHIRDITNWETLTGLIMDTNDYSNPEDKLMNYIIKGVKIG